MKQAKTIKERGRGREPFGLGGIESRFIFRGNVVGVGGRITRDNEKPIDIVVPVHGASSLPTIGGLSVSKVEKSDPAYKQFITFGPVATKAEGMPRSNEVNVTTVSVNVQNVVVNNPPHKLTAKRLAASFVSDHPRSGQPRIRPEELAVDGMELGGKPVEVDFDRGDFEKLCTLEAMDHAFTNSRVFFKKYRDRFLRITRRPPDFGERIPRVTGGYVVCSLARRVIWGGEAVEGNSITLDGFGTVYFGEILISEYNRRFTLVRMKLGSAFGGDFALAEVDPNGSWAP